MAYSVALFPPTSIQSQHRSNHGFNQFNQFFVGVDETVICDEVDYVTHLRLISSPHLPTRINQQYFNNWPPQSTVEGTLILNELNYFNAHLRSNTSHDHGTSGFSREAIERLLSIRRIVDTKDDEICVVCQDEYKRDDRIGQLGCGHEFHVECISKWLLHKKFCPICKAQAFTTL